MSIVQRGCQYEVLMWTALDITYALRLTVPVRRFTFIGSEVLQSKGVFRNVKDNVRDN